MTHGAKNSVFGLLLAVILAGCSDVFPACIDIELPGIRLVVNSRLGTPEGEGAVATAAIGDTVISFQGDPSPGTREMMLAFVPFAGTYRVEVSKQGFQDWVDEDVRVMEDRCGILTTEVEVALEAS